MPRSFAGAAPAVILPRESDIGGLAVRRLLPHRTRRLVGPFVFLDHMGPADIPPGGGIDVRPHPHIGLATVTYLFSGRILHHDSLGFRQPIEPGAVNWMIAGRGIVHSERTLPDDRRTGQHLHGMQAWVALPVEHEQIAPAFSHHPAAAQPVVHSAGGARLTLIAGRAYGREAPAPVLSPLFYIDAALPAGASLTLPVEQAERALYVVEGRVRLDGHPIEPLTLALADGAPPPVLTAETDARVMILGGAPLGEPRHVWWNFVASRRQLIEQAKAQWKAGRFAPVPGETDALPLPE
ncbi:pirin family protein [Caenispirillum salinarum]|uniref:pirin family protein n=1 Tax=Caenispirillum salinarum TaxID=859058 RepID=UPI0038516BD1